MVERRQAAFMGSTLSRRASIIILRQSNMCKCAFTHRLPITCLSPFFSSLFGARGAVFVGQKWSRVSLETPFEFWNESSEKRNIFARWVSSLRREIENNIEILGNLSTLQWNNDEWKSDNCVAREVIARYNFISKITFVKVIYGKT